VADRHPRQCYKLTETEKEKGESNKKANLAMEKTVTLRTETKSQLTLLSKESFLIDLVLRGEKTIAFLAFFCSINGV